MLSTLYLLMFSWWSGGQKTRERNHWSSRQCLCLCLGFHLSLFPHSHNSFGFFTKTPPAPPTLKYNSSQPQLNLPRPPTHTHGVLMSDCTPAKPECPTCVCAPVWLLAWSVWTARRRKPCQVGGAPRLGRKERLWCSTSFLDFSIAEHRNPDVWASFIRKKALPNGHKPIQNVTRWRLPSLFLSHHETSSVIERLN